MIVLFTDFGLTDPYIGQLHAVLAREVPGVPVIDLFHSVPDFNIRAGAYLLPAYTRDFPPGTVFVCVVDPGVGGTRRPVMLQADKRWYVGPDNGLFEMVRRRATEYECRVIHWRPPRLSASFHGRDLFAPVAARLARGEMPDSEPVSHFPERRSTESLLVRGDMPDAEPAMLTAPADAPWPDDLAEIIYIDHYGNGVTGLRAMSVSAAQTIRAGGEVLKYARVFSDAPPGEAFWYENANGLVEIAVNGGSAASRLDLKPGDPLTLIQP
ncbi:MAG: SAM-dependent chlorinase/fluorinase [Gammaproteobacteria bacterium]|nr:SAM-dependent chlorinase/fluorinase [Gammaproteobacteria bacterium]